MENKVVTFRIPHVDTHSGNVIAWGPIRKGIIIREYAIDDPWVDVEIKLTHDERKEFHAKTGKWIEKRTFYVKKEWIK
jgi:hypothetical protein